MHTARLLASRRSVYAALRKDILFNKNRKMFAKKNSPWCFSFREPQFQKGEDEFGCH